VWWSKYGYNVRTALVVTLELHWRGGLCGLESKAKVLGIYLDWIRPTDQKNNGEFLN